MIPPNRVLPVSGLSNLRDVGGYPTRDGGNTAWRTFFRSDSPHRLSQTAVTELLGYGIGTVIDLRGERDLRVRPNPMASLAQVGYYHIPISDAAPLPITVRGTLNGMFRHYLDNCQGGLANVFHRLAIAEKATLVHCNGGMHRTAIVTALYLGLAGVPAETIVQDFALSATCLAQELDAMRARRIADGWSPEDAAWFTDARPETMVGTLEYLDGRYGGAEKYLSGLGLTGEELSVLRNALRSENPEVARPTL